MDLDLHWPPCYIDVNGEERDWDDLVEQDEDAGDEGARMTYRELAYEICDEWGGIEDFLDRQWLYHGDR